MVNILISNGLSLVTPDARPQNTIRMEVLASHCGTMFIEAL